MQEAFVEYIIGFLIGDNNVHLRGMVSYGDRDEACVTIVPSSFFDSNVYLTDQSLPKLPLSELDGTPILFGKPIIEASNGHVTLFADLVASTFFLITRYEECVRRDVRDCHGRFIGAESLPAKAGFIRRPIVEEYGILLRKAMRLAGLIVAEPENGFGSVYLTHDIDQIWTWANAYRAIRTTAKRVLLNTPDKMRPILSYINYRRFDPASTFDWLIEQGDRIRNVMLGNSCIVCFVMGCETKSAFDDGYITNETRTRRLMHDLQKAGCIFGYHVSYQAAQDSRLLQQEKDNVERVCESEVFCSRNHYLDNREPEDYWHLIRCGIQDDFTMTYADVAGFRIGTSRPVKWIDPISKKLTSLTLHPTTIMECTLDSPDYMGVTNIDDAFLIVKELIDEVYIHRGDVVLLWHSPSVFEKHNSYQRDLYKRTIGYILNKQSGYRNGIGVNQHDDR